MAGTLVLTTLSDGTNSTSATNCIQGSAKAWVNFGYISSAMTTRASYNVSSVTRVTTGRYTITFTNPFADDNYVATGLSSRNYNGASNMSITSIIPGNNAQTQTASNFTVTCQDQAGNENDVVTGSFAVFR